MTASDRALPLPPAPPVLPEPETGQVGDADAPVDTIARGLGRLGEAGLDRVALAGVMALAALLYLWNLTVSGFANTYYAMAAQAGAADWRAFFFGSLDAANFITLDKPPAATWVMSLFVKAFGLSAWSVLLPQALLGVGSVAVLYMAVRRAFGRGAATLAAIVLAVTPAAALIFRYDNPDALLTFLLVTAAWALGRGLENGRLRWVVLAASLVGLGFLTKYLQAYLVLPAFALVWLVAAPGGVRRRLAGLAIAAVTVLLTSGWWVAIVELIPASARPYIGGSTDNSVLDLIFGYDGLGRIFGQGIGGGTSVPSGGSGPGGFQGPGGLPGSGTTNVAGGGPGGSGGFGGEPGILRMFNPQFGGEISWLIPLALVSLAVGLIVWRRAGRSDRRLAAYALWGTWLVVHVAVFSFMSGIAHPYYTVMLAPAVGALVGAGVADLWRLRSRRLVGGAVLAVGLLGSAAWAFIVLERIPSFAPGLGIAAVALAVVAGLVLVLPAAAVERRIQRAALGLGLAAALAGSTAFTFATTTRALAGGDPTAGPSEATGGARPVGDFGTSTNAAMIDYVVTNRGSATWIVAAQGSGNAAAIQLAAGAPVLTMGGFSGTDAAPSMSQLQSLVNSGQLRYVLVGNAGGPGGPGGPGGSGVRELMAWVSSACTAVTLGSPATGGSTTSTLYDCAGAAG